MPARSLFHHIAVGTTYKTNLISSVFADALVAMEKAMKRDKIDVNDRQVGRDCLKMCIL